MRIKDTANMAKSEIIKEIPLACSNELAAVEFLENKIWKGTPRCPHCESTSVCQIMDAKTGQ
ncbi:MAG: transposase, partial [Verrucomicrobiota bacterium]